MSSKTIVEIFDSKENITTIFINDENMEKFKLFINFLENYYNNNIDSLSIKNIDFLKILINLTKKYNNDINKLGIYIDKLIFNGNFKPFLSYFTMYYDNQNEKNKKKIVSAENIIYTKFLLWQWGKKNYNFGDNYFTDYNYYESLINLINLYCNDINNTNNKNIRDIMKIKSFITSFQN